MLGAEVESGVGEREHRAGAVLGAFAMSVALLALAFAVCWFEVTTAPGQRLAHDRAAWLGVYASHDGLWVRLLRGGLGRVTIPVVLVVAAVALAVLVARRWWWAALGASVVMLGANVTVQAAKHGVLPFVPGFAAPLLSGHIAVVAGAGLAVTLTARGRRARRVIAWVSVAAVVATGVGVVVASYHSVAQAVAPVLIFLAWAVPVRTVLGPRVRGERGD